MRVSKIKVGSRVLFVSKEGLGGPHLFSLLDLKRRAHLVNAVCVVTSIPQTNPAGRIGRIEVECLRGTEAQRRGATLARVYYTDFVCLDNLLGAE